MRVMPPRATPSYASPAGKPSVAPVRSTTILSGFVEREVLERDRAVDADHDVGASVSSARR